MSSLAFRKKVQGFIFLIAVIFFAVLILPVVETECADRVKPVQRVGASIRIDPTTVIRGGQLSVTGAGFLPNEAVSMEAVALWKGFDIAIGDVYRCNASGAFSVTFKLPSNKRVNLGLHTLQVYGADGSVASSGFTVAEEVLNPQNAAVVIITPNKVAPKGKVVILGSGFAPKEQVSFELVGAWAGFPITVGPLVTCNEYGAFMAEDVVILNRKAFGVFTLKAVGGEGTLATAPIIIAEK